MIYDFEQAFVDYLTNNMDLVVGHGNDSIPVYRNHFDDESDNTGIVVYLELCESHSDVPELENIAIRILVRHKDATQAFYLIQNIDAIFDKQHHLQLNDTLELCLGKRNSGPSRYGGTIDEGYLHYWTVLYTCLMRRQDG